MRQDEEWILVCFIGILWWVASFSSKCKFSYAIIKLFTSLSRLNCMLILRIRAYFFWNWSSNILSNLPSLLTTTERWLHCNLWISLDTLIDGVVDWLVWRLDLIFTISLFVLGRIWFGLSLWNKLFINIFVGVQWLIWKGILIRTRYV